MLMKKILVVILCSLMLVQITSISAHASSDIRVELNDEFLEFDVPPMIINGRTLVPVRAIFEKFGLEVGWEEATQTVTGKNDRLEIILQIDNLTAYVNGESIQLDQPAAIVNSRTLIPIRFIAESTGAIVYWKDKERIVDIAFEEYMIPNANDHSSIVPLNPEMQAKVDELNERVSYIYDERYFVLYAFMNFTGYDDENNSNGYSEVRELVRNELDAMNLNLYDNNYYANRKVAYNRYDDTGIGLPPSFNYLEQDRVDGLVDLNLRLKEFYEEADIHSLYEKYRSYYEIELEKYKEAFQVPLIKTLDYLRVENPFEKFYIHVNLLDSYWRGSGLGAADVLLGYGISTGPSPSPNAHNIIHEYMHGIVNPIVDKHFNKIKLEFSEFGYTNEEIHQQVAESLTQAVALIVEEKAEEMIEQGGEYPLIGYFYNHLMNDYPEYRGTFEEFCVWMFDNYK